MPRNIVEDVVPPEKRSIRSVPLSTSRKTRIETETESTPTHTATHTVKHEKVEYTNDIRDIQAPASRPAARSAAPRVSPPPPVVPPVSMAPMQPGDYEKDDAWREIDRELMEKPSSLPRYILWGVVIICVIIIGYFVAGLFTGATITITPHSETASVNATLAGVEMSSSTIAQLAATEEATTTAQESNLAGVPYQVVTFSENLSQSIPATGTQTVSSKATGSIVIYNAYSTAAQKLITNTRFETTSGLIYRISAPVTVPGMKGSTPGSITVTVTADQPGALYNIGLSDFTLPGLATNATEFKGIYARSATVMQGGASGMVAIASASDTATAKQTVEAQLDTDLLKDVTSSVASQSVFYNNLAFVNYVVVPIAASATSSPTTVNYTEIGTINAIVFDRDALASAIAASSLTDYDNTRVEIPEISTLGVTLESSAGDTTPWNDGQINFTVTGNATIVWDYSQSDLKNDLIGQPKSDLSNVLVNFPAIVTAQATIRPFWKSTFPTDPNKITIVNEVSTVNTTAQ